MKAMVFSGGGSVGTAWHTGVCQVAVGVHDYEPDILCGVSAGALVASFLSQYEKTVQGVDRLVETFNVDTSKVYKSWFFGAIRGIIDRPSFFDSRRLHERVRDSLDPQAMRRSGKEFRCGATSMTTGGYRIFDQNDPHVVEAVIASSAFQAFLTPVAFDGEVWSDGGPRSITPIQSAIDAGADEIIVSVSSREGVYLSTPRTALDHVLKTLEILIDNVMVQDLETVNRVNRLVEAGVSDKRIIKTTLIQPSHDLDADPLVFESSQFKRIQRQGFERATQVMG